MLQLTDQSILIKRMYLYEDRARESHKMDLNPEPQKKKMAQSRCCTNR